MTGVGVSSFREAHVQVETAEELSRRLRVSLTAACNFSCFFCHNEGQGVRPQASSSLSIADYVDAVQAAVDVGVRKVKLTGGEPLLYRDGRRTVVDLIHELATLRKDGPWFEISMTTNGALLPRLAGDLKAAGLDRVTLSMHAVDEAHFAAYIAKAPSSRFFNPLDALDALAENAFVGTKINTVLFGDQQTGSLSQLAGIARAARDFQVAELRLYTILDADRLIPESKIRRDWLDGLAEEVAGVLMLGDAWGDEVRRFAARDCDPNKVYRETLISESNGLRLAIDAMQPGRYGPAITDEGPYAIRVSADGRIRAFLSRADGLFEVHLPLDDRDELKSIMRRARLSLEQPMKLNAAYALFASPSR